MNRCKFIIAYSALTAVCAATWAAEPALAEIQRLVELLGSRKFSEREAASKALAKIGKPAVPALRKAAKAGSDAEVRRRAGLLVSRFDKEELRRNVQAIVSSALVAAEKGRRLRPLLRPGMGEEVVRDLLGKPEMVFYLGCGLAPPPYRKLTYYANLALAVTYEGTGASGWFLCEVGAEHP